MGDLTEVVAAIDSIADSGTALSVDDLTRAVRGIHETLDQMHTLNVKAFGDAVDALLGIKEALERVTVEIACK